jgi:hypothetical protein
LFFIFLLWCNFAGFSSLASGESLSRRASSGIVRKAVIVHTAISERTAPSGIAFETLCEKTLDDDDVYF